MAVPIYKIIDRTSHENHRGISLASMPFNLLIVYQVYMEDERTKDQSVSDRYWPISYFTTTVRT